MHVKIKLLPDRLIWIVIILFALLYSLLSVTRHLHFQSGAFDLGLYDQAVWQYSRFLYPFNTIKMRMVLGDHLALTLPLISPLYWLWDDVKILLIFQAAWISLSAYPVYKYVILRGLAKFEALILSGIYLAFYGIQFMIFFDFHPVAIGVGLLAWILYLFEAKKWRLFTLATILLLLIQENMGLALFALSFIWFFQGNKRKLAILLGGIGLIYTFIAFRLVGYFSNVGLEYGPEFPRSPFQFITRLFDSAEKRKVWLYSFAWYSFIPVLSLGSLLAVLSDLIQYFITGEKFSRMWSPFMHHRAILSIYLFAGTVNVLTWLKKKKIRTTPIVITMLVIALFQQYYFHFALNKLSKSSFWKTEQWMLDNREMLRKIPPYASVAAQQSLVPHLSHREKIYLVYPRISGFKPGKSPCGQDSCWWLDFAGTPEYLVVDTHPGIWLTMLLEERENFLSALSNMEKAEVIDLIYQKGSSHIYSVNHENLVGLR